MADLKKAFRVVVSKTDNHIRYKTIAEDGDIGTVTSYDPDIYSGYDFNTKAELEKFIYNDNDFIEDPAQPEKSVEPESPVG